MRTFELHVLLSIFLALLASAAAAQDKEYNDLDGIIEPSEIVEVSSQVPGILEEVLVERGDRVKKNQVLARLKSGIERVAIEAARARIEFGKRKALRSEELYRKDLMSDHDRDELETEIQMAELQLREATERLELRTVRSTIAGVVVERLLAPGEYVGEGHIMTVARINPLYVEVIVPVARFGSINKGMRAQIRPEPPVGGVFVGRVVVVDQVIDAASGTFGVRLELPNPSYRLPAGLKCKVRFLKDK